MKCSLILGWLSCWLVATAAFGGGGIDYAESRQAGLWLQDPVLGGPSFDSFVHSPHNPLLRGTPPFEWPVNGFLFADPVGGNWYIYVGDYPKGYASRPSRCMLLRSQDQGGSWTNLGVVLEGNKECFDRGGATPDVSVVYADGRYHMVYDWVQPDWREMGGLAYAWAEKPEGPFHRARTPLTLNRDLPLLLGKYRRTYAATLIRRKHDWMILAMMDSAPNSWALFGIIAPRPEGPYGERILLRNVEDDQFHPPLLEFYPAFTHDGFVYAPATSVALNRDYNALFRAPLERATEPRAWDLVQNGSVWHSDDVENEAYGLWGQTFSGWVDAGGVLHAMFPSRDSLGMGTVNVAWRPWNQPLRKRGFVMSGHQGASLTLLRRAFAGFRLDATLRLLGTARLLIDYDGALGPNLPQSDATLHRLCLSRCHAVELTSNEWRVVSFGRQGERKVMASGAGACEGAVALGLERQANGHTSLSLGGRRVWSGDIAPRRAAEAFVTGIEVEPHSHLVVELYRMSGKARPGALSFLFTQALLGAGQRQKDWRELAGQGRYGVVALARQPGARVKWNVVGRQFALWSPCGPEYGRAEIRVDGRPAGTVDLQAEQPVASAPVWKSARLKDGPHAVVLVATQGRLVVDSLQTQ